MSANPFENLTGFSPRFEKKGANRHHSDRALKRMYSLKEKWCRNCERSHGPGLCQYPMVQRLVNEGLLDNRTITRRLLREGYAETSMREQQSRLALQSSQNGMNGGDTGSVGQQQQQTGPRASRFSEGPFDESDSDASESESAPSPRSTHAKEQHEETGKSEESEESEESLCLSVVLLVVSILLLWACWTKFGLRFGLVVYGV